MKFNTLEKSLSARENEMLEEKLDIFLESVIKDKMLNELPMIIKSEQIDTVTEIYEPMTKEDQETITELLRNAINRIP